MSQPWYSFLIKKDRYRHNTGQNYLIGFSPEEMLASQYLATIDCSRSPRQQLLNGPCEIVPNIEIRGNVFQVDMDVKHFTLDELSVKTGDDYVLVKAKHGDKKDSQGWVSRQFTRKFQLPEDCNFESAECCLSDDGVLTVTVPLDRDMKSMERVVPIIKTGALKRRSEIKIDRAEEVEKHDGADEDASEKTRVEDGE